MGARAFENSQPAGPLSALPWSSRQTASRSAMFLTLGVAIPAALVAIGPLALLAAHLATDQGALAMVTHNPTSAAVALVGFAAWLLVFGVPVVQVLATIGSSRHITIADGCVTVCDHHLSRQTTWSQNVFAYHGVAHRVTTSLSSTRHELILVHPIAAHSILLVTAPKIDQAEIDAVAQVLGCREIAAPAPYQFAASGDNNLAADHRAGQLAGAH